ncbi:MAG: RNA methyltransferase [Kosmotoga sp.]|nr:MAG: RNA methyltransferase [Kosmotoga sp.]
MKEISNRIKKDIRKLSKKKYRQQKGLIVVEGINPIIRAFENNIELVYLVINKNSLDILKELNVRNYDKIYTCDYHELKGLSNMRTPYKMMAVFQYPEKELNENKNILYLEHIQDPANLGTLIRSAVAFGFPNIILSKKCVNPYLEKVIRSSSGYIFDCYINKRELNFEEYKKKGYKILGASLKNNAAEMDSFKHNEPIILILGNEGQGISESIGQHIDRNIRINMDSKVESLNVAIAGSIIMHKFYRS